ncbi:hypothetical protein HO173_011276 [Letharia columbiana]|uniref:Uncharacterized protein n=1 Tax=Letharia columbiana TaxID=112416 RepID=A0A8H6FJQ5_9LECA|nr:uncharacterized protein HO173_011276 [Letharia columbiana]KAF6229760.1 hypothetical protein HO173_011276 [Letharia columbiana]
MDQQKPSFLPPKTASIPPNNPESYLTRVVSYTSWPHTSPNASAMAKAGFHQQQHSQRRDLTTCSTCGLKLSEWECSDDPLDEHVRRSPACPFLQTLRVVKPALTPAQTTPIPSSAPPKVSLASGALIRASATSTAAAETSISTRATMPRLAYPPPPAFHPPHHHMLNSNSDRKAENALAQADSPGESKGEAVLDVEGWVELGFDGEEKDDWVKV